MAYSPLQSSFYQDVAISPDVKLAGPGNAVWRERRADALLAASQAGKQVEGLAAGLSDRQSKMLLTTLRQAAALANGSGQTLVVDFWERQYTSKTLPAEADRFVYVREDLPRAPTAGSTAGGSEFRIAVQFS